VVLPAGAGLVLPAGPVVVPAGAGLVLPAGSVTVELAHPCCLSTYSNTTATDSSVGQKRTDMQMTAKDRQD